MWIIYHSTNLYSLSNPSVRSCLAPCVPSPVELLLAVCRDQLTPDCGSADQPHKLCSKSHTADGDGVVAAGRGGDAWIIRFSAVILTTCQTEMSLFFGSIIAGFSSFWYYFDGASRCVWIFWQTRTCKITSQYIMLYPNITATVQREKETEERKLAEREDREKDVQTDDHSTSLCIKAVKLLSGQLLICSWESLFSICVCLCVWGGKVS